MSKLQQLYDEVSPQFYKLFKKREEIRARSTELTDAMKKAEEDYDVEKVEEISTSLSSAKKVFDRINKDIKKLQNDVYGKSGHSLNKRLSDALSADHKEESENARELFERRNKLIAELEDINNEITKRSTESHLHRDEMVRKFKPFMPTGVEPRAMNLMNLTDVTKN